MTEDAKSGAPESLLIAVAVASATAAISWLVADGELDPHRPEALGLVLLASALCLTSAVALVVHLGRRSMQTMLLSPLTVAVATWVPLFVIRPLTLSLLPHDAATSLGQLGFTTADLSRTAAIGSLGCASWCIGYAAALWLGGTRGDRPAHSVAPPVRPGATRALAVLAVGSVLCGALWLRQGGLHALLSSPVSIRTDQTASFYGFVGFWIIVGVALCVLVSLLEAPSVVGKWLFACAAAMSLAAAAALQIRGLAVFAAMGAAVIYFRMRPVRKRQWVVLGLVVVVAVPALEVMERVRAYSAGASPGQALEMATHTPVQDMYLSDISLFDNLAAMQQLVPRSVGYLDGASIAEIPAALVPRALWRHKPEDVDHRVAAYLYPGSGAGVPITFQGELYWNGGLLTVALGGLLLGLAFGGATRFGLRAPPSSAWFLLYALAVPFTYALLTRALATMVENLVFAFVGVGAAFVALRHHRRPREHDPDRARASVSTPVSGGGRYGGFRSDLPGRRGPDREHRNHSEGTRHRKARLRP